jgi:hypothetical protein
MQVPAPSVRSLTPIQGLIAAGLAFGWVAWQWRSPSSWHQMSEPIYGPSGPVAVITRCACVAFFAWFFMSCIRRLLAAIDVAAPNHVMLTMIAATVTAVLIFDSSWNAVVAQSPTVLIAAALASWVCDELARVVLIGSVEVVPLRASAVFCAVFAVALQPAFVGLAMIVIATTIWRWWRNQTVPTWMPAAAASAIALVVIELIAWRCHTPGPSEHSVATWRQVSLRVQGLTMFKAWVVNFSALTIAVAVVGCSSLLVRKRMASCAAAIIFVASPALLFRTGSSGAVLCVVTVFAASVGVLQLVRNIRFELARLIVASLVGALMILPALFTW